MAKANKKGKPKGLRLDGSVEVRLAFHAKERGEDELDIIRRGLITELERIDALIPDATRAKLNKLREAGLDFDLVVIDALARKAADDAQMRIKEVLSPAPVGAGR